MLASFFYPSKYCKTCDWLLLKHLFLEKCQSCGQHRDIWSCLTLLDGAWVFRKQCDKPIPPSTLSSGESVAPRKHRVPLVTRLPAYFNNVLSGLIDTDFDKFRTSEPCSLSLLTQASGDPQAQLHRPLFSDSSVIKELDQRRPGRYHKQRGHLFSREIKSNAAIPQARATTQTAKR